MPSFRGGGAERVMLTLAEQFTQYGFSVDIVVLKAEGPYRSEVAEGVNIVALNVRRMAFAILPLVRYLRRSEPEAMLSTISHTNVVAIIAKMVSHSSCRVAIRESSIFSHNINKSFSLSDKMLPILMRVTYPFADGIIAVSKGVANELCNKIKIDRKMIDIIYNPVVDKSIFLKAKEELYHPWFKDSQLPVVLGVGRLIKIKGFDLLIRAIKILNEKIPVRLIILGEGTERKNLEKLINDNSLNNSISLLGFVRNPFSYMKRASVYILSSRSEGLPNALIQSMVLGTPVVATNCSSGPDEILESGRWGTLIPPEDPKLLSNAIQKALEGQPNQNSQEIADYCKNKFGKEGIAKKYLTALNFGDRLV